MSTNRIDDPALKALEDRLIGAAPQLSAAEQSDLLYQCAFAAGRQAMLRPMRRWQAATAALLVLLVGLSVPLANRQNMVAKQDTRPPVAAPTPQVALAQPVMESIRPPVPIGQFDAWQVALDSDDAVASNLKQLERTDPEMRSLAVAALTRAALQE